MACPRAPRSLVGKMPGWFHVVHGRDDETLPVDHASRTHEMLEAPGVAHHVRLHDAGHVLAPGMRRDVIAWHAALAAGVRPAW